MRCGWFVWRCEVLPSVLLSSLDDFWAMPARQGRDLPIRSYQLTYRNRRQPGMAIFQASFARALRQHHVCLCSSNTCTCLVLQFPAKSLSDSSRFALWPSSKHSWPRSQALSSSPSSFLLLSLPSRLPPRPPPPPPLHQQLL